MAQTMVSMAAMLQNVRIPDNARPIRVELPQPPALTGSLTPNNWLAKAQRLAFHRIQGPESIAIDRRGTLFTGLKNGWVVAVRPNGRVHGLKRTNLPSCGRRGVGVEACGRPLGMRLDPGGHPVFVDAYSGIFKIDMRRNGRLTQLVNSRRVVEGRPLGFLSDLAVLKDGTIFFTSSSTKWNYPQSLNILLEGEKSGRLLMYSPSVQGSLRVQQVLEGLSFPNGLQLSKNEDYLLIAEGARAKIYRVWIGARSPKRGAVEVFADNLPGFVENIRLSPRGTYWVGFSSVRFSTKPSLLDSYGARPAVRRRIMGFPNEMVTSRMPKYGLVVELNEDGKIIRSLHDPTGDVFSSVSEVEEFQGKLYLGSPDRPYIGVLSLNSLPPPVKPVPTRPHFRPIPRPQPQPQPQPHPHPHPQPRPHPHPHPHPQPQPQPHPHPHPHPHPQPQPQPHPHPQPHPKPGHRPQPNPNPNPNLPTKPKPNPNPKPEPTKLMTIGALLDDAKAPLGHVLHQMNRNMDKMNGHELRDTVLVLLKSVIETKKEASKTMQSAVRLKADMTKLKTMLGVKEDSPVSPSAETDSTKTDKAVTESPATAGTGTGSDATGTGSDATGTGSETNNETSTFSSMTVAPETTPASKSHAITARVIETTESSPTTTDGAAAAGGGGGGFGGVDGGVGGVVGGVSGGGGGDGNVQSSGASPNDPAAPNFNSGCVSGSLTCGVY